MPQQNELDPLAKGKQLLKPLRLCTTDERREARKLGLTLLVFTRVLNEFTCLLLALTHAPVHKIAAKKPAQPIHTGFTKKRLKHRRPRTKDERKENRTTGYSRPGGPAIRITVYMRPRSFASPARTARTARTKRKRRRNEADLPVTGVGQAGLAPLNLRYTNTYTHI